MKQYDFIQILQQHWAIRTEKTLNIKLYLAFKDSIETVQPAHAFKAPSTRFLAENMQLSRDTVEKAFQRLEDSGLIERKHGKGSYIQPLRARNSVQSQSLYNHKFSKHSQSNHRLNNPSQSNHSQSNPSQSNHSQSNHSQSNHSQSNHSQSNHSQSNPSYPSIGLQPEQADTVLQDYQLASHAEKLAALFFDQNMHFFADGMPEIRNFPFKKWYETEKQALKAHGLAIFLKDQSAGVALLQQEIASFCAVHRQIHIDPDQVLIVNSTQQALYLCSRVLFERGDQVLMENPYYSNAKQVFELAQLKIQHVAVDHEGMAIEQCTAQSVIKGIYVTPSNQYPTTVQMSLSRRQALIKYAQQHRSYIIEDDYDALMFDQQRLPAIFSLDQQQRTIYMGSFSKYILPSLRMSYLILPRALLEPFQRYRNSIDGSAPSQYFQVLLGMFMQQGHYARYLKYMQQLYAARYHCFITHFDQYLGEFCEINPQQASMQVACYFHPHIAHITHVHQDEIEQALVRRAKHSNIDLTGLSQFYATGVAPQYGFVLGFSALSESEILVCMQQLQQLIRQCLSQ